MHKKSICTKIYNRNTNALRVIYSVCQKKQQTLKIKRLNLS